MPPITQSRSNSIAPANQQLAKYSPQGSAASMLDAFNPENLLNLEAFLDLLSINKPITKEFAFKKRLNSILDLSNHSARSVLHLSKNHACHGSNLGLMITNHNY